MQCLERLFTLEVVPNALGLVRCPAQSATAPVMTPMMADSAANVPGRVKLLAPDAKDLVRLNQKVSDYTGSKLAPSFLFNNLIVQPYRDWYTPHNDCIVGIGILFLLSLVLCTS